MFAPSPTGNGNGARGCRRRGAYARCSGCCAWATTRCAPCFADDDVGALERWRAADIEAGLVDLAPGQLDRFLPAALGLGRLGAVSVRKGCYPGQEIVARLHFKGGNKRWLHRLAFTAAELPVPGTELVATGADAPGEVLQAAWTVPPGGVALAVLPESPAGAELSVPSTSVANFRVVSAIDDAND